MDIEAMAREASKGESGPRNFTVDKAWLIAFADLVRAEECDRWKRELSKVMPPDFKDWHQNSDVELPDVAAWAISNLRSRVDTLDTAASKERARCANACKARYMGDNTREDMEALACEAAIRALK